MKISRNSQALVDAIYVSASGWRDIAPTPLRDVIQKETDGRYPTIERVHFVRFGDYLTTEFTTTRFPYAKGTKR